MTTSTNCGSHPRRQIGDGPSYRPEERQGLSVSICRFWPSLSSFSWDHIGIKSEITMIWVLVFPIPLMANDFERHVGVFNLVGEVQQFHRRDGDSHQNKDWDYRPQNFDCRIMSGFRWNGILALPKPDTGINQQAEHEDRDQRDYPQEALWKSLIITAVGVTGGCNPICHGSGPAAQSRSRKGCKHQHG